jgi:phage shock protein C
MDPEVMRRVLRRSGNISIVERDGVMAGQNWLRTLSKAKDDRWIGGVCGGLGKHTPVPSWTWRVIFSLFFFCFGTGLLIYLLLWVFMPKEL